jgi:ABC-type lipoprotein export system ATPase subunit
MTASGTTVVIATHERDIGRIVDRTIELADGRVTGSSSAGRAEANAVEALR